MILEKQFDKKMLLGKVSLIIADDVARTLNSVDLAGSFKNWNNEKKTLKKFKDESCSFSVIHEKSREYHFKYLIDSSEWPNQIGADKKVLNKFRSENSVVVL